MLNDRDYMRRTPNPDEGPVSGFHALIAIIVLNVICFLFKSMDSGLVLTVEGIRRGEVWLLVTSLFLHGDFFHIFFNMFSLYIFGSLIAPVLGGTRFLILYFVSGIAGNLLWLLLSPDAPYSELLGASGAVMGVIMASAMMRPNVQMFLLFIPFPIKLRTLALVFIAIELFNQISADVLSNVAYLAHLGGFLGGFLLMRFAYRRFVEWDPLSSLSKQSGTRNRRQYRQPPQGWTVRDSGYAPPPPPPSGKVTQQELDALLDKVSAGGINSLTEAELARLRQAREQMRGGRS